MKGLTKRQGEVLSFIKEFIHDKRYSPSYREIMRHFGFTSLASVAKHVHTLQRKGVLTLEKHAGRSLAPLQETPNPRTCEIVTLPYIGHIAEREPIQTFARSQTLAIPEFMACSPDRTYVLQARGDGLKENLIADGDLLLIEAKAEADEGDMIVGQRKNYGVTVKLYRPEGNSVRLSERNGNSEVLRIEELTIMGVVIGVIRLFG